jgi:phosphate-selective porin OprO/OprP
LTSSTDLLLTERPLAVEAFNHRVTAGGDYKAGVSIGYAAKHFTATGGLFGSNFSTTGFSGNDESWGPAARVTFAPINEKTVVLHLGASGYWRNAGGNGAVRFRSGPEVSTVDSNRLVDTGSLSAKSYASGGVELAGLYGPFYAQAEYLAASVDRPDALPDAKFDGGYVMASYALTGESRGYKNGIFTRIKPENPFSFNEGGLGAWEIAARYSTVDLNDGAVLGGKQNNYEAGINWYPNAYIRFALDYVNFDATRAGTKNSGDAIVTRVGVSW